MTKRFVSKKKKKHPIRKLGTFLFFSFLFTTFFFYSLKRIRNQSNETFLKELLNDSNPFIEKGEPKNLFHKITAFFSDINLNHPVSLIENFFHYKEEVPASDEEEPRFMSVYIKDPNPILVHNPIVYIYNTHQLEGYNNENIKDPNVTPNVMMASYVLKEALLKMDIPSIVEDGNISEFLKTNNWNYNASYEASRFYLKEIMEKEPTLEYFIDVHRDSIKKEQSTVNINGISYAKVLFVIGTDYDTYQNNLRFTREIEYQLNQEYPGISRGIVTHGGKGYNGVYNQDLSSKVILLECGGYENTMDEVYHTMDAFSKVFSSVIGEGL